MHRLVSLSLLGLAACTSVPKEQAPYSTRVQSIWMDNEWMESSRFDTHASAEILEHQVLASADRVWEALPAAFARLELPAEAVGEEAHVYGSVRAQVRTTLAGAPLSRYLDCGSSGMGAPNADTYTVHVTLLTHVRSEADSVSTVSTRIEAYATPRSVSGHAVRCASTGTLAKKLVSDLHAALSGPTS